MSEQRTRIAGQVDVSADSSSRVALELMQHIAYKEKEEREKEMAKRDYWLSLYQQCWRVTHGGKPGDDA